MCRVAGRTDAERARRGSPGGRPGADAVSVVAVEGDHGGLLPVGERCPDAARAPGRRGDRRPAVGRRRIPSWATGRPDRRCRSPAGPGDPPLRTHHRYPDRGRRDRRVGPRRPPHRRAAPRRRDQGHPRPARPAGRAGPVADPGPQPGWWTPSTSRPSSARPSNRPANRSWSTDLDGVIAYANPAAADTHGLSGRRDRGWDGGTIRQRAPRTGVLRQDHRGVGRPV